MSIRDNLKIINIQETTNGVIHTIDKLDFNEGKLQAQDLSIGDILLLNQIKKLVLNEQEFSVFYGYKG